MGNQTIHFNDLAMRLIPVEEVVRRAYDTARKIDGLSGRIAFMRACQKYAAACPDVPEEFVPQRVAEILNPKLRLRGQCEEPCSPTIN
jgi:hypothetical protein|tara:strand:+ start:51 stop:314 length:264 start_codon:yes stop_codon:yes gene_type:complete